MFCLTMFLQILCLDEIGPPAKVVPIQNQQFWGEDYHQGGYC
jgi:hypothetical protein